jgi:putative copper export protein
MIVPSRSRSISAALCVAISLLLVIAPAALAENGAGLAGPVTDKTVTFFCFGVIAFFAALVIILSLIQGRLEKRKEQRYNTLNRLS